MARTMRRSITYLLLALVVGCSGRETPTSQTSSSLPEPPGLREEGLLLLMSDRRYYDSFSVGSIRFENPDLAVSLATALGRIGDAQGLPTLHTLLMEGTPEVRQEAAFALGRIGDASSARHLVPAVADSDNETSIWAIATLADMDVELDQVMGALGSRSSSSKWERLSPYLFRYPADEIQSVAARGLQSESAPARAMSAFALARNPQLESLELLRSQLDDPDPWVRGWVARALGQIGDRTDIERLRVLLDDSEPGPTIQALRAAHRLVGSGMAAPASGWRAPLLELIRSPHAGVSMTAIETAGVWLLDEDLGDALQGLVDSGSPRQQEVALLALAEGADPRAADYTTRLVTSPDESLRTLSASAATRLGDQEILQYLLLDESALVRGAALAGLLAGDEDAATALAMSSLEDPDPGIRAQVMGWMVDHPVGPADLLSRAILGPGNREVAELRLNGIRALLARALVQPLERGLVVENLESLAQVGEYPARLAAADALEELERPPPSIGPAGSRRSTTTYMQVVLQTDKPQTVEIETSQGKLRIELECTQSRMTCLNFLQLARQGFYDGQVFHRVIPDFVVQGGDPRGDGWGGPGYTIRDELSRTPFERGVIGMASSGPETAGSQFFITLSRQPHLDGRYTTFGKVVRGDEVLDKLVQGDRIERVVVVR